MAALDLSAAEWIFVIAVTFVGGFVKGAVGFALPLVMISALPIALDARIALAALIVPTLASNVLQVGRAGPAEAVAALRDFWRFIAAACIMVFSAAQVAGAFSDRQFTLALGVLTTAMALLMLGGPRLRLPLRWRPVADIVVGTIAGTVGGIAGVWGPPTVLYLVALGTARSRQMTVQGVAYLLGSVTLLLGHLRSGILNAETLPLSLMLLVPAGLGMGAGFAVGARVDPALFRRITLFVLIAAGLNLVRRSLTG